MIGRVIARLDETFSRVGSKDRWCSPWIAAGQVGVMEESGVGQLEASAAASAARCTAAVTLEVPTGVGSHVGGASLEWAVTL